MKRVTIFRFLISLLWMITTVKCDVTIDKFLGDILSTFKLMSPTIIYSNDEAPEICWSKEWLLCLRAAEHVDEHIHTLFIDRKQDSIIVLGRPLHHSHQKPFPIPIMSEKNGIFERSYHLF